MTKETYEKCKGTMFTFESMPRNTRPVGSERIGKDNYIWVKVSDELYGSKKNWKTKHQAIYESHYGEISKGHVVIFADGNIRNFDINNLVCVSRKELLYLNQNHLIYKDCELTKTGVLIARLQMKVKEKER